jgi:hypothetical protein
VTDSARARGHGRAAVVLGHHATQLLIGSIVAVVLLPWVPLPDVFMFTLPLALFGFVILSYVLMRQHDRRLCEACMLSMPLNAAERASAYKLRFWMAHNLSDVKFMVPYMVVLISSNFATNTTIGRWCWAIIQLSMIYLILSYSTHRKLQPWCPWCRDGGGGEHVEDLPPVLPHDDRQLV